MALRIKGAESVAAAADAIRSGAPLNLAPGTRTVRRYGATAAPGRTNTSAARIVGGPEHNVAERVLVDRNGGHRTHQPPESGRRNRARSHSGRRLVDYGRPVRNTNLRVALKLPNMGVTK
jgi:hypothetical protein